MQFNCQLRQKWEHYFTTPKQGNQPESPLRKWANQNRQRRFRKITQQRRGYQIVPSRKHFEFNGYVVLLSTILNTTGPLKMFGKPGTTNLADYFAKHYPYHHHCRMRSVYLHFPGNENNLRDLVCYSR